MLWSYTLSLSLSLSLSQDAFVFKEHCEKSKNRMHSFIYKKNYINNVFTEIRIKIIERMFLHIPYIIENIESTCIYLILKAL